jgi:hypothetical protein
MKVDFRYPLPLERLHARYDPVFDALKANQSVHLIGLPDTGRSGYLKFILSAPDVLPEFINPSEFCFVILEPADIGDSFPKILLLKLMAAGIAESNDLITHALKTNDNQILREAIITIISKLDEKKIVFVLYSPSQILEKDKEIASFLARVLEINRTPPNATCLLLTISSPSFLDTVSEEAVFPLHLFLEERKVFFPLFDDLEMKYLRHRLEHLLSIVISDELDREVRSVADGHTILYRTLINQALHMGNIDESRVKVLTESIWQALGKEQIKNIEKGSYKDNLIIQKLNLLTPVGALRINFKNLKTYKPQASAQDLLLKSFFEKRPNILITRDEVAKELWGEEWEDKYSDWAMDQAIYSLRKIVTEGYNLQTLRNRGYILATN